MHRPPPRGRGLARGGYSQPAPFQYQNPYLYQNPNLLQSLLPGAYTNPISPFAPFQIPIPTIPAAPDGSFVQNPNFPPILPHADPREVITKAETAVAKAHRDLLASGEQVTSWKVSQSALLSLKADSWSSLGIQMQDVQYLRRLMSTEAKVDAYIHCFVGSRKITSLHDLDISIRVAEGIERFEELGLGPLLRHPLVKHYFLLPSDAAKVPEITSEDIVACLGVFMDKGKRTVVAEEFLIFLMEKHSVGSKEALGVRIRNLGVLQVPVLQEEHLVAHMKSLDVLRNKDMNEFYITRIREAKKAENYTLQMALESMKGDPNMKKQEVKLHPPTVEQKMQLDRRFGLISERVDSFSFSNYLKDNSAHIRFDSSSDDDTPGVGNGNGITIQDHSDFRSTGKSLTVSTCPYPSTSEEMARLGLKSDVTSGKSAHESGNTKNSEGKLSRMKKRKLKWILEGPPEKKKTLKGPKGNVTREPLDQFIQDVRKKGTDFKLPPDLRTFFELDDIALKDFIATWKFRCQEHSVFEVFNMMLFFYAEPLDGKNRGRFLSMIKFFSSYPGIGLLNVAVASVKLGIIDTIYGTFQSISESAPETFEMIDVGPSSREPAVAKKNVTRDDVLDKMSAYTWQHFPGDCSDPSLGKTFSLLKNIRDCETWLTSQFCVQEFSSLGHGDFFEFLHKNVSLLPRQLYSYFIGGPDEKSSLMVTMNQNQLQVFISQAENTKKNAPNDHVLALLRKQFPTINFHVDGNLTDNLRSSINMNDKFGDCPSSVSFSAMLLDKHLIKDAVSCHKQLSAEVGGTKYATFPRSSSEDAIKCLLNAPMLSDLLSWSHWDVSYAPSLGPFINWFLNGAQHEDLSCIVTSDGKFVRVDPSSTPDDFLDAAIQGSSFHAAVKLLSLVPVYGGTCHVPLSLLKQFSQKAIEVMISNFSVSPKVEIPDGCNATRSIPGQAVAGRYCNSPSTLLDVTVCGINRDTTIHHCENKSYVMASKFVLDCLAYLPSEFRNFAAEILVSGLQFCTRDAHTLLLRECKHSAHRIMLHDIGLSLGIVEWIEDYKAFFLDAGSKLLNLTGSIPQPSLALKCATEDLEEACNSKIDSSFETVSSVLNSHREDSKFLLNEIQEPINKGDADYSQDIFENTDLDAVLLIESIRREEFGLDSDLGQDASSLLKKQHARLGRALHCLSQELYSQDSHLLLELIQNADDNFYPENAEPTLIFILQTDGIIVLNNEIGFSAQNIRALCDIGNSTKSSSGSGYIGNKGIGFKSVFRVTDAPEIHSNGFHVKFDISEGQIGFVLPTLVSACDTSAYVRQLTFESNQTNYLSWNTCIVLPFRPSIKQGSGISTIITLFTDIHPSLLLFLHRLNCIQFKNMINDTHVIMKREAMKDGIIKVSHGPKTTSWLVVRKTLQGSVIRPEVQSTEIAVAFTLQELENGLCTPHLSPQPVFAFLPLRHYGLKFILQGDFILPSSREEVDEDSAWNQWLLSEIPSLFVGAEKSFYDLPCFRGNPGKAVSCFMSFVPLPGEVHGFFCNLPNVILSKLRSSCCLLLEGHDTEWFPPCRALKGWDEQAQLLLSDTLLQQHLGVGYLRKDIALSDTLAKALGVRSYSPKILIDAVSSICLVDGRLKLMGLDWLASFLVVLNTALSAQSIGYFSSAGPESDIIQSLKEIPIVPLSDGTYCSVAEGPIWLPVDSPDRLERNHSINNFPLLYGKLRTVDPLLLSAEMSYICNIEEKRIDHLRIMLHKIGVQDLSAHEIIKTHILHHFSHNRHPDLDKDLMVEYLAFVMLHFQCVCPSCLIEKDGLIVELQSKHIILTNHGYKCPSKDAIHFGKEFGNPVDITKLVDYEDTNWNEVDAIYLKHCSTLSLTSPQKKWRDFFLHIGVTDFVKVISVEKNAPEFINSVSTTEIDCLPIVKDCESPELVRLLLSISSKKNLGKSRYLLEVLDDMWDDYYRTQATGCIIFRRSDEAKPIESSFMKSICSIKWISSKIDNELHSPRDLFYDCDEVRSILGVFAAYAVPKVHSKTFLKDIGFKMQVTLDDAIKVLQFRVMSDNVPVLSILQMSNLYNFIWERSPISKEILDQFKSMPWIFVPCIYELKCKEPVPGSFFPPDKVYWHDPTGCVHLMQERTSSPASLKNINLPCKALDIVYPGLHDFFVSMCGLHKYPSSSDYIEILLQLSSVAMPSQASHAVFQVFLKWADDIETGSIKSEEISQLKESLTKMENTVLPTVQEKWVSLHPAFGLICWCDDDELRLQFAHSDSIDFLHFGELSYNEKVLFGKVSQLMQKLGVHALSEVVSREAIFYGTEDNGQWASMINWILPYIQRYLFKLHLDRYQRLEKSMPERINQLQIFVVENLFYKHTLKGKECSSRKRFECCCLLQGNTLYIKHCSDSHSVFLELSRLFFDGIADLQLANFLHMINIMAESGSNREQIDFFVVNSQKVPNLPEVEPIWSLLSSPVQHMETSCNLIGPAPLISVENFERNTGKPILKTNWPPTNWKNAPVFGSGLPYHIRMMPDVASQSFSKPSDAVLVEDIHFDMRINEDGASKDAFVGTTTKYTLQDLVSIKDQPHSFEPASSEAPCRNISDATIMLDDVLATSAGIGTVSSLLTNVETLAVQPPSEDDAYRTGRLGEAAAYRYFSEKLGSSAVKWVNKELETGLPYDILISEGDVIQEYIEVKTTKSRNKNWFLITMREWQFAIEKGDAFSIARVVLVPPSNAQVAVLKNPARLCQKNSLHLAILMQDATPFAAPS